MLPVKRFILLLFILLQSLPSVSQKPSHYNWRIFSRADSLRGNLTPLRTCYDVTFYHLDIKIDPENRSIKGSNTISFNVVHPFKKMQVDLFPNMKVDKILFEDGTECKYTREFGAVFITLPEQLESGNHKIIFLLFRQTAGSQTTPMGRRVYLDKGF